ncbi:hypothetical protein DRZ78_00445 [Candidatus Aerophobetes bacterium]|uniref:MobA-like NTP transferase domain-containing protein n=1 Tax=Aerophobetes bacterium TaxID=2030807 RepID=A0A662D700_UNCAE|nr:MAG: hypothetical protein DRZ78_00445 [Candidatus Aerophobetes bacterium]
MKAVILAAGQGKRLGLGAPKALAKVDNISLIERTIHLFLTLGIRDLIIVVGYKAEEIEKFLSRSQIARDSKITWVENKEFHRGNGLSVFCVRDYVKEHFLLSMVDHIYEPAPLLNFPQHLGDLVCVVDSKPRFADPEGATKVLIEENRIKRVGKNLVNYNALDCGLFLCSRKIFPVLEETLREGKDEWDEAKDRFAQRFGAEAFDLRGNFWLDVDTLEELTRAEGLLRERKWKR